MLYIIIGLAIFIYMAGISCYVTTETIIGVKSIDGEVIEERRKIMPRDLRIGALWPFLVLICLIKGIIFIINEGFSMFCLFFGYEYRNTKIYKKLCYFGDTK